MICVFAIHIVQIRTDIHNENKTFPYTKMLTWQFYDTIKKLNVENKFYINQI